MCILYVYIYMYTHITNTYDKQSVWYLVKPHSLYVKVEFSHFQSNLTSQFNFP